MIKDDWSLVFDVQVNKDLSVVYKGFLYFLAFFFALITVATSAASLRYIIVDSINYSVFSNIWEWPQTRGGYLIIDFILSCPFMQKIKIKNLENLSSLIASMIEVDDDVSRVR